MARGRAPATGPKLATTGMLQAQAQAEAETWPAFPQPPIADNGFKDQPHSSRTLRSTRASAAISPSTELVPPPSPRRGRKRHREIEAQEEQEQKQKQKRQQEEEEEPSSKRLREDSPDPVVQPLTRANLKEFLRRTESRTSEGIAMDRKRSLSRQSSSTGLNQETESALSQKSSSTAANYRFGALGNVRIVVQKIPLPDNIRARVKAIYQREIPKAVESQLLDITDALRQRLLKAMNGASKEDDSVEPILDALEALNDKGEFAFTRKADWIASLKPNIQRKIFHLNLREPPDPADQDMSNPPNKRLQSGAPCITPDRSDSAMPPPSLPRPAPPDNSALVKTPRPDITIGFEDGALLKALVAWGIKEVEAEDFLEFLHSEQLLSSCPLQTVQPLRFPLMVVEGKSYTTGRTIFEAQNQAAVSGSCMTNMQHKLADLVHRTPSVPSYQDGDPLAFSICTEGPTLEVWVHYTTNRDGVRFYHMNILRGCNAAAEDDGLWEFITIVYKLMCWARTDLLTNIATQLALVKGTEHGTVST